ncbi:hypothetical protein BGZ76_002805 [Entomortierella beljakovae]|nr:hypothetical protein BGZ76_002805 [Entomortierella beljakovae]
MVINKPANPLEITEILFRIGEFIPLWGYNVLAHEVFIPHNLLGCLSVSHHFRETLLPVFWYIYDEVTMPWIPSSLVKKYSQHIRIIDNYGENSRGKLSQYENFRTPPVNCFEKTTRLIEFSGKGEKDLIEILERQDNLKRISFFMKQPRVNLHTVSELYSHLKNLVFIEWNTPCSAEARLETLRRVGSTLVELRVADDGFIPVGKRYRDRKDERNGKPPYNKYNNGDDDDDNDQDCIVLPKLKTFHVRIRFYGRTVNYSKAFPNLETLHTMIARGDYESAHNISRLPAHHTDPGRDIKDKEGNNIDDLEEFFQSRICPNFTNLYLLMGEGSSLIRTARAIKALPRLEQVGMRLAFGPFNILSEAILCHSTTLTKLHFQHHYLWNDVIMDFVIEILKNCAVLATLSLGVSSNPIDRIMDPSNWNNAESFQELCIIGDKWTLEGVSNRRERKQPQPPSLYYLIKEEKEESSEALADQIHFGWKVIGGRMDYNTNFLKVFSEYSKPFVNLKTLEMNKAVYKRKVVDI